VLLCWLHHACLPQLYTAAINMCMAHDGTHLDAVLKHSCGCMCSWTYCLLTNCCAALLAECFPRFFSRPVQLYTAAINACMANDGTNFDAAFDIYATMQRNGVEPDDLLYGHLIALAGRCRKLEVRSNNYVTILPGRRLQRQKNKKFQGEDVAVTFGFCCSVWHKCC
jgi:pentatricopeptide repeat protein